MSRAVLLAVAGLGLGFAPVPFLAPKTDSAAADLKALQGVWITDRFSVDGEEFRREEDIEEYHDGYQGRRLVKWFKGEKIAAGEFVLDGTTRPRRMLLDVVKGEQRCRTWCIYQLEGDTLTLCHIANGEEPKPEYPSDFQPKAGVLILVYKRKKP